MKKTVLFIVIFSFQFSIFHCAIAQWTQLVSGTSNKLEEIFFPVADTGYVVGEAGTILKTTDGTAWSPLTIGSNKQVLLWGIQDCLQKQWMVEVIGQFSFSRILMR